MLRLALAAALLGVGVVTAPAPTPGRPPLAPERCRVRRFDSAVWRDSARAFSREAARGCMVDDLLARRLLLGRTRPEVLALLGPDDRGSGYFADADFVYYLGPERGVLSLDSEWLLLRVDATGRVRAQQLATD